MSQPTFQPPQPPYPTQPAAPPPQPPSRPRKVAGTFLIIGAAVLALVVLGSCLSGLANVAGDASSEVATESAAAPADQETSEAPAPTPTKTAKPWKSKSSWVVKVKETSKKCYGSGFGCLVTVKLKPLYTGGHAKDIPDDVTVTVYFKLHGDEDGVIKGSFEINDGQYYADSEVLSTKSKGTKVHADVVEVEVD